MAAEDDAQPPSELRALLQSALAERDQLALMLRERERDRQNFFATRAHELRTPLAAMRSAVHVLRVADHDRALARAAQGMIERQVTQLARLIDALAGVAHVPALRTLPPTAQTFMTTARRAVRVLIVDDNHDGAQGLALMLDLEGHEVRIAADGLEALQIAEEFQPNVVLLDIGMPGIDGYETARRLRARPWAQSALLCAQTGWGQEADKCRARSAGFDRHLVKPVDPKELNRILADVCQPASAGAGQG